MAAKLGGWLLYLGIVAGILYIGWNQPLRYRFLSPQEIEAIEHPTPPPTPVPSATLPVPVATPRPGS